jgi:glycosyltransferase involved in cell wall biosynthesis
MPTLSIIVPVYKVEPYLHRCVDSILAQTFTDFELILVDDGSPDRCGEILDSFAKNKNVIVIHQDNAGLSAARNTGLIEARGEYVMFVDSDDYLLPDAVQILMDCARKYNADIVEGGHQTFNNKGVCNKYCHEFEVASGGAKMFGYPWGKVYRTELFNSVCFPKGYWYEDTIMHAIVYPQASTTVCLPDVVYGYFVNQQGITAQTKMNVKCIDTLYVVDLILDYYAKTGNKLPVQLRCGLMGQLGTFLFFRTRKLDTKTQMAVFALAAEMLEKYHIPPCESAGFYENEVYLALKNRQYKRWKWASILV